MGSLAEIKYSVQDYLEIEASTGKRYEFFDGEVFEVEGASIQHNRILANLFGSLSYNLRAKPCKAYTSQLKVLSKTNNSITYPDIAIVCGEPKVAEQSKDIITNPSVVIEIVSPSTGDYDHGEKFRSYRWLPSLKEYILISSTVMLVEKFIKQNDFRWTLDLYEKPDQSFTIETIGLQVLLKDIYDATDIQPSEE